MENITEYKQSDRSAILAHVLKSAESAVQTLKFSKFDLCNHTERVSNGNFP